MARRPILLYPDPRLRRVGEPVRDFGPELQRLVDDLIETMYAADGLGLAAMQVGVPLQLFVVDPTAGEGGPDAVLVFANTEILEREGEVFYEEGCLSFPGIFERVRRAAKVRVRAQGRDGEPFELEADGKLAVAIQHEHDHGQGRLLIDHLGPLRRRRVHRAMLRYLKQREAEAAAG